MRRSQCSATSLLIASPTTRANAVTFVPVGAARHADRMSCSAMQEIFSGDSIRINGPYELRFGPGSPARIAICSSRTAVTMWSHQCMIRRSDALSDAPSPRAMHAARIAWYRSTPQSTDRSSRATCAATRAAGDSMAVPRKSACPICDSLVVACPSPPEPSTIGRCSVDGRVLCRWQCDALGRWSRHR